MAAASVWSTLRANDRSVVAGVCCFMCSGSNPLQRIASGRVYPHEMPQERFEPFEGQCVLRVAFRARRVVMDFDEHAVDWGAYRAKLGEEPAGRMRQDVLTWERYNQRLTWLVAVGTPGARRHTPIFSNNEPAEVTLRLLSDLHPDYVLLTPTQHARLFQLMVSAPHRFARVAAEGDFQLYRVRPAASSQ